MGDFLQAVRDEKSRRDGLAKLARQLLTTTIKVSISDGDEHEFKIVIRYDVSPGAAETGRYYMGDPDAYDPGSPPEIDIRGIRIFDGETPFPPSAWLERIIRADENLQNVLVAHATGGDA